MSESEDSQKRVSKTGIKVTRRSVRRSSPTGGNEPSKDVVFSRKGEVESPSYGDVLRSSDVASIDVKLAEYAGSTVEATVFEKRVRRVNRSRKGYAVSLSCLLPSIGDIGVLANHRATFDVRLEALRTAMTVDPDEKVQARTSEALMLKQVLLWLSMGEIDE